MATRQRKWQKKKEAEGKCGICGKDAGAGRFCKEHYILVRQRIRQQKNCEMWQKGKRGRPPKYCLEEYCM